MPGGSIPARRRADSRARRVFAGDRAPKPRPRETSTGPHPPQLGALSFRQSRDERPIDPVVGLDIVGFERGDGCGSHRLPLAGRGQSAADLGRTRARPAAPARAASASNRPRSASTRSSRQRLPRYAAVRTAHDHASRPAAIEPPDDSRGCRFAHFRTRSRADASRAYLSGWWCAAGSGLPAARRPTRNASPESGARHFARIARTPGVTSGGKVEPVERRPLPGREHRAAATPPTARAAPRTGAGRRAVRQHQPEARRRRSAAWRAPTRPGGRGELLRGHVPRRRRPARPVLDALGEVEVEEHRPAVVGQQHVRRLDVAVQDAAVVGVGQPVGQSAPIHSTASTYVIRSERRRVGGRGERPGRAAARLAPGRRRARRRAVLLARSASVLTSPRPRAAAARPVRSVAIRSASVVRPRNGMQTPEPAGPVDRVDRDDVGVLEAGERAASPASSVRHLERDRPAGQVAPARARNTRPNAPRPSSPVR